MITAGARMLELTSLQPGATAADHFLSIQLGSFNTGPLQIFEAIEVELMADYEIELEAGLDVTIESNEYTVEIEPNYEVEIC